MLDKEDLAEYRWHAVKPRENRALAACARFRGHALLVDSLDTTVAHAGPQNCAGALSGAASFQQALSLVPITRFLGLNGSSISRDVLEAWLTQALG